MKRILSGIKSLMKGLSTADNSSDYSKVNASTQESSGRKKRVEDVESVNDARVLEKIRSMMQDARSTYLPELTDSQLEDNGAVFYMNERNGTAFDWFVNDRIPDFFMFYNDKNNMGAIKLTLFKDGSAKIYVYAEQGNKLTAELDKKIDEPETVIEHLAIRLKCVMDDKKIWGKNIQLVDLEMKIRPEQKFSFLIQSEELKNVINMSKMSKKFAIVSREITENGWKVGFMYRYDPSENDAEGNSMSGWVFTAGFESDEYINDQKNLQVLPISQICSLDSDIQRYICHPVGTEWIRVSSDKFELDKHTKEIFTEKR